MLQMLLGLQSSARHQIVVAAFWCSLQEHIAPYVSRKSTSAAVLSVLCYLPLENQLPSIPSRLLGGGKPTGLEKTSWTEIASYRVMNATGPMEHLWLLLHVFDTISHGGNTKLTFLFYFSEKAFILKPTEYELYISSFPPSPPPTSCPTVKQSELLVISAFGGFHLPSCFIDYQRSPSKQMAASDSSAAKN